MNKFKKLLEAISDNKSYYLQEYKLLVTYDGFAYSDILENNDPFIHQFNMKFVDFDADQKIIIRSSEVDVNTINVQQFEESFNISLIYLMQIIMNNIMHDMRGDVDDSRQE